MVGLPTFTRLAYRLVDSSVVSGSKVVHVATSDSSKAGASLGSGLNVRLALTGLEGI